MMVCWVTLADLSFIAQNTSVARKPTNNQTEPWFGITTDFLQINRSSVNEDTTKAKLEKIQDTATKIILPYLDCSERLSVVSWTH